MRAPPVPRLVASRVACMRGGQVVIRDVNMTLHEGGAMLLTGPNASGKSTFLRLLATFLKPSAGKLLWDGHDLSLPGLADEYRTQVHLVGSKDAVKPQMSVYENVHFWEMLEGGEGRTMGALEFMGLGPFADRQGAVLSMGQRKRLQLARLLAIPRPLWLLDEPSVGLDSEGVKLLEQMMAEHRRGGGMVLVATHVPISLQDCMHLKFPPSLICVVLCLGETLVYTCEEALNPDPIDPMDVLLPAHRSPFDKDWTFDSYPGFHADSTFMHNLLEVHSDEVGFSCPRSSLLGTLLKNSQRHAGARPQTVEDLVYLPEI